MNSGTRLRKTPHLIGGDPYVHHYDVHPSACSVVAVIGQTAEAGLPVVAAQAL